jgi:ComF family protein
MAAFVMTVSNPWHGWLKNIAKRIAAIGSEAFFPAICGGCGRLFKLPARTKQHTFDQGPSDASFRQWMNHHLCGACSEQFRVVRSPLCVQCGQPFESSHGPDHTCGQCAKRPFYFSAARAAGLYEGALRTAIHQLKYQGCDALAKPLGRVLWQTLVQHWDPSQIDRVVPVPLHSRRLRQRGFNQACALLQEWPRLAERQGAKVASDWIDRKVLRRLRPTPPQTGLLREQRATNMARAFEVHARRGYRPLQALRVLLVDDVMTTGTTADACAQTLLAAGAAEVRVLTLARAVIA